MSIVTRLTSNGTLYTTGTLDEATFNPNSTYRKNLFQSSNSVNTVYWATAATTLTPNAGVAPDGTMTASLIVGNSGAAGRKAIYQYIYNGVYNNVTYVYSVYLKSAGFKNINMWMDTQYLLPSPYNGAGCLVDLTTGIPSTPTVTVIPVGNGWYRCSVIGTPTNLGIYGLNFTISLGDANGSGTAPGDGFSGVYVWGPQLEVGTVPTVYEPTGNSSIPVPTAASKLDANGNVYLTGTIDEATFNPSSGYVKNLYAYSQNFAAWLDPKIGNYTPYALSYYGANTAIAPDGTQTAWTMSNIPNQNSSFSNPYSNNVFFNFRPNVAPPNSVYTKSIYAKWVNGSPNLFFQAICYDNRYVTGQFNLQTGVASGGSNYIAQGMVNAGNGWWRCWSTFNSGPGDNLNRGYVIGDSFFVGGYGSTNLNTTMQFWGTQMELGTLGPYVATDGPSPGYPYYPATSRTFVNRLDYNGNNSITDHYDEFTTSIGIPYINTNGGNSINLLYNTNNFEFSNTWSQIQGTTINAQALAPDGTYTARLFTENTTVNAYRQVYTGFGFVPPQTTYVVSCYFKPNGRFYANMGVGNSAFGSQDNTVLFNLSNGTMGTPNIAGYINTYGMIYVGNGWWRCWVNATTGYYPRGSGYASFGPLTEMANNSGVFGYNGDGVSGMYLWGAQVEVVQTKTEGPGIYIPTNTAGNRIVQ